jgi:hypothetical protein
MSAKSRASEKCRATTTTAASMAMLNSHVSQRRDFGAEMPGSVPAVARDAYNKITGPKEWFEIAGGHFGLVYFPGPEFEAASSAQAHFLSKHLMR